MVRKAGRRPSTCAKRSDAFVFTAELPGLSREQVRIDVHDNRLTLQGRREARVSCEQYHQVERGHGEFCRTFVLPHAVNAEGVTADLADGVLTITVPKLPGRSAPPRRRFVSVLHAMLKSLSMIACCWRASLSASCCRDARPISLRSSRGRRRMSTAAEQPDAQPAGAGGEQRGPDFTRVAAQTVRAVTNISSVQVVRRSASPFANDPFFQYFFGDQGEMFGRSRAEQSLGSGVVISADGYVVTNNHVIGDDVAEVTVTVGDHRDVKAKIIGVDSWTDLALLKIDATGLPVIPWGDSSKLKVAEWVMAVGNPFSLNQTVTLGIVSALGRANVGITQYEDFIQTDAAINPGNSGGALINGARRADRHQHRDLFAERRLPGHRLRGAQQPGAARRRRPDEVRPGAPRLDRSTSR